jgi:SAM-dependent methyltransferase
LWSRRWEYPFVAQRILDFAQRPEIIGRSLTMLDAGSGVTFFPYYICQKVPSAQFACVDYDATYTAMFDAINRTETSPRVRFVQASLQKLPLEDAALDVIACISVLEHTDNYGQIIDEFFRVLRPGDLFVLTFDVSLDGKFTLPIPQAEELLRTLQVKFTVEDGADLAAELSHAQDAGVLTSDHVRATEPELLPWTFPVRVYKAARDLVAGKGWTAGFRSRTIFCCSVVKPR